ncbi:MAG: elongation factor 1-beta [Candidatus Thermoplasmatota archaeon]|nr:elongation factor 1-beta [Candidatus Thermoplasmatota archaeon]
MGEIIAVFKVMPASVETDLATIEKQLADVVPDGVKLEKVETKPVAFGLKALHATITMEDSEEISVDGIEEAFQGIDGVESVSVEAVGRA